MIIGVDFDNTIVSYDEVIHQIACEKGLIPGSHLKSKRHIRDAIRKLENGEMEWQKVQAIVYGPRMKDAKVIEGALVFLKL